MSNAKKIIIAVIAIAVIGGSMWLVISLGMNANKTQSTTQTNQTNDQTAAATITYTSDGFQPQTTTVNSGQTVKIANSSGSDLEFASDPHPTHTLDPELNTSTIASGSSTIITVTKKGSWGYHNHFDPTKRGTLVVN